MTTTRNTLSADIARRHGPQRWVSPMTSGNTALAALFFCLAVFPLPGGAHHSHGNYELSDFTHLEGTVQEVHLLNPHSWIFLEVPGEGNSGEPTLWALEAATPATLRRNGIEGDDVLPGDLIRVRCHRLRDGSDGCLLGFVTPLHGDPERGQGIEKEWD
ncbi:MAG: DUF6152 family protein [Rhodospirillaceae bacterium]|nr:DUF6152 family protein [Rhodospirillaceae bacterium]MDE0361265.1 DUF6152 family protein [Rhodospirillaceae bacterium]